MTENCSPPIQCYVDFRVGNFDSSDSRVPDTDDWIRRKTMMPLWGILLICNVAFASFCGKSGVPFSVEILPTGSPVLGCAQPSCVAQPVDDVDDSVFNTDETGQIDGFFREGDNSHIGYLQTNKIRANCSGSFDHLACTKKNQWVGGIEYIDHPRQPLLLQCCTFDGLRFSQIVGVTPIGPGEAVTGGEVVRDGRQISFDVIANIRKVVDRDDPRIVSYEVTVRRMNCLSDPPEVQVDVDDNFEAELLRVLEKANNGTAPLGHEGHAHVVKESGVVTPVIETEKFQRNRKRKNRRLQNLFERPGSFGAPIFNPIQEYTPQRHHYPRRIITTPKPPKQAVVRIEMPTTTMPTPLFTFPSLPPLSFPTLPPPSTLLMFPGFPQPAPPQSQLPAAPAPAAAAATGQAHASGVSQDILQNPHPLGVPMRLGTSIASPFYHPFGLPSQGQQSPLALPAAQQPFFPFLTQTHTAQTQPSSSRRQNLVSTNANEKAELIEPSLPPVQQHLGNLFQPPPFPALHTALQSFQSQG
ncbi:hypothetical protein Q1695_000396 [Nippostrongylus brasiliensis]|nr:hypothetical protein Q1695_000396 [Nippostrongylus brasiliensis]